MKLLHVIGSMDPKTGGPCQTIRNFAPQFMAQGHSLEVVCLNDPDAPYIGSDPFPVHAVGQGRGGWNYHASLLPWLQHRLKDFDAAILNGLWQYQGYALWKASQTPGNPPYYIFPHGMLDPYFQKLSVRPVKAMRNWLLWKVMMEKVAHDAEALLFTCEEERRLAGKPFRPYAPKQEIVVGLGLPDPPEYDTRMREAFYKKCPGLEGDKYFLFLGRVHPKKGVDLLIRGYAEICRTANRSDIPKLVIAGPGLDEAYGKEMQKLAGEICPTGSVYWPGMLTGDVKWGATYHCDAFVLPSHQENYGIAVVETLACGRPVLISSQINIWREIKECGAALVEPDTVVGATRLLQGWVGLSAEEKNTMAARARSCFQNYFTIDGAIQKLVAVTSPVATVQ